MTDFTVTDYFSDESVAADTYPYFDFLLAGRRVWREPHHGVVMVAGHAEVLTVLRDPATFSNVNIVAGPSFKFPVEFTGDDVTDQVGQCRDAVPMGPDHQLRPAQTHRAPRAADGADHPQAA